MNPFERDVNPATLARYMQSPSRVASMITNDMPGGGTAPAKIAADIINIHRADCKVLARAVDVPPSEINLMSPERAGELIAGLLPTSDKTTTLVEVFNELAKERDRILWHLLDEDEYHDYWKQKEAVMLTPDPVRWDHVADQEGGGNAGDDQ